MKVATSSFTERWLELKVIYLTDESNKDAKFFRLEFLSFGVFPIFGKITKI